MSTTIRIVTADKGPPAASLPQPGDRLVELSADEVAALVAAGVWASTEDAAGWTWADAEGQVWAGADGQAGQLAKVRGKAGRRLGAGRIPGPEGKRDPASYSLSQAARERLAELAKERKKSMSQVLEDLIFDA
jgi:hypothetical protein